MLANALPLAAWVAAHADSLAWLGEHYARQDRRLEALLLALVLAPALRSVRGLSRLRERPQARPGPLLLLAGVVALELTLGRSIDLHILRATLLLAGGFAVAGLYAPPSAWRAALPWAGLAASTLPFGAFADVYLGIPARLYTADAVREVLDAFGVAHLSRETVLVFDRPGVRAGVDVDLPCSGVRSLWAGGVLLLATSALRGPSLARFTFATVVTGALLLFSNTARVTMLVAVGHLAGRPDLASALHVPLGLFGFAWSGLVGVWLLRPAAREHSPDPASRTFSPLPLAACFLGLLAVPVAAAPPAELPFAVSLPFSAEPVAPTAAETRGLAASPPLKWRFDAGSLLLLPTRDWRLHHLPEACHLATGRRVDTAERVWVDAAFSVRRARVDDGAATAVWWFQSPAGTTDDLGTRTWEALVGAEDRWVLASLLLAGDVPPADLASLTGALRVAIAAGLEPT